eukprot:m.131492 g.131492  ORF g.131492 m.131492 type:complete len:611 (+) comp15912_c1_seq7:362-2194(+)
MSHRGRPRSRLFTSNRRSLHAVDFEAMRHEMTDIELKLEEDDIFQTEEQAAATAAEAIEQGAEEGKPSLEERQHEALRNQLEHLIPAEDMAQQMTLMDMKAFQAIDRAELTNGAWMKSDKHTRAPNVLRMTHRFNNVSYWVARTILFGSDEDRVDRLAHCIKLAKKLHEYNNLHGLLAVISGLHMTPVYRLNKTWESLKDKYTDRFERLEDFMSEDDNYSVVRRHLSATKLPCIPYLGMFLTDLTHSKTAAKSSQDPEHANDEQEQLLDRIATFQAVNYSFGVLPFVQDFLSKTVDFEDAALAEMDQKHYQQSLKIEPRRTSDESLERSEAPFRAMNSRLSSAMKHLKNGSLPFRGKAGQKGHRKTRSLGNPISFFNLGHEDSPPTGEENSLASADASALLDDEEDEVPALSAQDQAFQPVASLSGSIFSHSSTATSGSFNPNADGDSSGSEPDLESFFPPSEQFGATVPTSLRALSVEEEELKFGSIVKEGVLKRKSTKRFRNYQHYWVRLRQRGILLYAQRTKHKGSYEQESFRTNPATTFELEEHAMAVAIDPNSKHHSFHLVFDGGSKHSFRYLGVLRVLIDGWCRANHQVSKYGRGICSMDDCFH